MKMEDYNLSNADFKSPKSYTNTYL